MNKLDLVGQKFSKLTVISSAEPIKCRTAWNCICDCGNNKIIKTENLRSGDTKSCGCWNDEQRLARVKNMYSTNIKYLPRITTARRIWKSRYSEMLFEDFYILSQQDCFYCSKSPDNKQNSAATDKKAAKLTIEAADFIYNGIDRIDNTKDHSDIKNCVPCCKFCNWAKRDRTTDEFKEWIINLYYNFIIRKIENNE